MSPRNPYVVLGVPPDASMEEIRSAYRRLAKQYHPDVSASADAERFHEIQEAYEVLTDPKKLRSSEEHRSGERLARARRPLLEIVLSPKEAARGGEMGFEVALETSCSTCNGTGEGFFLLCTDCRGAGRRLGRHWVSFRIPPGIQHGDSVRAYGGPELGDLVARVLIALRVRL